VDVIQSAPKEIPLGRSLKERFNSSLEEQQALVFDTRQGSVGNGRSFNAGSARTKDFYVSKKFAPAAYQPKEFRGAKSATVRPYETREANTRGKHELAEAGKQATTKTAAVKDAREATKTSASRALPGGDREYLGPERKKLERPVDPASMGNWRNGQARINGGAPVEQFETLKPLTVEDVRELLNKNK
jgi:hypothetical protein